MHTLNVALFQWLAAGSHPTPWVLSVACDFALWGSWLSAGVVALALWRQPADRVWLFVVAAAAGLTSLLAHTIAMSLDVPRPFMLGLAPAYISHGGRGSLPSTHASVMFMVALAFLVRPGLRGLAAPLLALAAVTGWARVYVGVHFPLDIVAGLLLGSLVVGALFTAQRLARRFLSFPTSQAGRTRDSRTAAAPPRRQP